MLEREKDEVIAEPTSKRQMKLNNMTNTVKLHSLCSESKLPRDVILDQKN